ncbi:MAG TPA: DUF5666 domain-containing protein [Dehalococcoidia bacterium]|nr:DUF5666 domain-containing protein [Dehalococcoidia bacterium]
MNGLKKIFVASIAVFFVLFLSSVTFAGETEYSLKGQVVAFDPQAHMLTVTSTDKIPALVSGTLGEFTFSTDEMTQVTMCSQNMSVDDIKVGQEVTVSYHERDGQLYADSIAMPTPPLLACLLEGYEQ